MAATAAAPPVGSPPGADAPEQEDSNVSSPLSEVDDKDGNDEDIDMQLNDGEDNESSVTAEQQNDTNQDDQDSDSDLSDARSVAQTDGNDDGNDTEAETERLYDTPRHQRQRDVVVDQYNDGQVFEHTPSKLRRAAAAEDDHDHADDESIADDAASDASDKSDVEESPTKAAATKDTSVDDENQLDSQDRKRKRSVATDNSDSEQPLRKRLGSVGAAEADIEEEVVAQDDEADAAKQLIGTPNEEGDASPEKQDASAEESNERETRATKKTTRSGSKRKDAAEDADEDTPAEGQDEAQENEIEDEQEEPQESNEAEAEEEADLAAKNAEEAERRQAAFKDWSRIEDMFGTFRDRLYTDRLQRLEQEEQSLLADDPSHTEYLNMKQCLDDRLEKKLREINTEKELRMRANERRFVAIRAQVWSQFAQSIRERRESVLETLNREWYDIQTARRNAHSTGDRGLIFPKDPAQRIRNAVAYNTEVSTLAGMAKYEGFPAGPQINGASNSELNDDLNAIDLARRGRQRSTFQPREEYQTSSFDRLGPAGEQFLKDTPWANPNHSAHKTIAQQLQPNEIDGQVPISGRGTQPAPANSATATVDGPISQQRSPALSSRPSESPELARSALKTGSIKRTALPNPGRESKTAAA